jgi:hypothetical protein
MLERVTMTVDYKDPHHLLVIGRAVAQSICQQLSNEHIDQPETFKKGLVAVMLEHPRIGPFVAVMGAAQVIVILTTIVEGNDLV